MINYKGDFESKKDVAISNLPAGVYVGKVLGAKVETQNISGLDVDRLVLQLDVAEGDYKDHYKKVYEVSKGGMYPAKFKGIFRITIPQAGDQYEAMNKRILQGAAWALEESNIGYKWDFDETKLKGLSVGFSVRDADYLVEDSDGVRKVTSTEICRLESVKEVKAGTVKPPKKRELKDAQKQKLEQYNASTHANYTEVEADEELPF
jgi:hypothetical protein